MKWQTKQANPPTSILSKVEKIHNDQITKETPTTKYQETHTKANDGVGRALEDRQPNEDYVLKCHPTQEGR
jgi:hypothetical protein